MDLSSVPIESIEAELIRRYIKHECGEKTILSTNLRNNIENTISLRREGIKRLSGWRKRLMAEIKNQ